MPLDAMNAFQTFIQETMQPLDKITIPIAIYYGDRDDAWYTKSAEMIYQHVQSSIKRKKGFENSKHLMTLGRDQDAIIKEMMDFLQI